MKNKMHASHLKPYLLVLDVGTTGIKALVFDQDATLIGKAYKRLNKFFPHAGWVEQNPREILSVSKKVLQQVVKETKIDVKDIRSFGMTNQRETVIVWDKQTGSPVYPAIVWEDRRTRSVCAKLKQSHEAIVRTKTGLGIEPYFSASKIHWVLENVPRAKKLFDVGRLLCGTVDTWLLWNLCEHHPHVTDETNASRTLLFDIRTRKWDKELLALFQVPGTILPNVLPSRAHFGVLNPKILGISIPVEAVCGDQQSSLFAALSSVKSTRVTKVTYGTGVFLMQTFTTFKTHPDFYTTIAATSGKPLYALEAKIEGSAAAIDRVLTKPSALRRMLTMLAKKVDVRLKQFPIQPPVIVIDGGITRDGLLKEIQGSVSSVRVIQQDPYEGTGLGIAKLLLTDL